MRKTTTDQQLSQVDKEGII